MPSSTISTVRPASSGCTRPPRYRRVRRSISSSSRAAIASTCSCVTPISPGTPGCTTRTPPLPTAPIAYSGWPGRPSLRTSRMSSSRSSAIATANATGTPPRGSASTIASGWCAYAPNAFASSLPAWARFLKRRASAILMIPRACRNRGSCMPCCPARRQAGDLEPLYWTSIRRAAPPCFLGSVRCSTPLSSLACAAASSTSDGKVKLRMNLRAERSE